MDKKAKQDNNESGHVENRRECEKTGLEASEKEESIMLKLHEKEMEAAQNYDRYLRAAAELDNYKKRAAREKADAIRYGNENLIKDMLPLMDSLDRAVEQASCNHEDFESFRKGLELIRSQFQSCLLKHGVEQLNVEGKEFDPNFHEALMLVESEDHENNQVVRELEKGYLLRGRLLRPAKVAVCKRNGKDAIVCEE
jgi:molecular chaperone GrpE